MRFDTPTSFAQNLYQEYEDGLKLTANKKSFTLYGQQVRSWSALRDYLPARKDIGFPLDAVAFTEIKNFIYQKLKEENTVQLEEHLQEVGLVVDILNGRKHVKAKGGVKPYHYDAFKESVDEEQFALLWKEREHAIIAFNPSESLSWEEEISTNTGPEPYTHYNTYVPPLYTYEEPVTNFPLSDKYVRPFFELFLPNDDERHYVLYWLYNLMHRKCEDILVLIGTQGNGKNTLMQLATVLAGRENTIIGGKSFAKEKFNSEVMKRKLVNLDEFAIKGIAKESLKSFANDFITVEAKGQDPVQVRNHCSFIVANNSMRSTELEFKDRRFTCPELSDKDLILEWGKEKIGRFKEIIDTKEFQIEFPYWLKNEVETLKLSFPKQLNYITPHFYRLVEAAKPVWFKEFKRQLLYKESVNAQDIYKATRTRVSDLRITEELEKEIEERKYRDLKPHVIATITVHEGRTQYVSKIYEGEGEDDEPTLP